MAVSDDKQNRLSTLSQDVIAVPKKPAAPVRPSEPQRTSERTSERKAIPPAQDVFAVPPQPQATVPPPPAPAYTPPPQPAYAPPPPRQPPRPRAAAPAASSAQLPVLVAAGVAGLALLVAVYAVMNAGGRAGVDATTVEQLTRELQAANERVARLEQTLSAASAATQAAASPSSPGQVNVLQISAGMRDLRNDIDAVVNDVARLSAELGEIRSLAGAANGQAKVTASQVEQVASRLATLNEQVAGLARSGMSASGAAATAAPASAETQAQIKALSARTEKMATDIRQLYRLVGGQ